MLIYLG